MTNRRVLVTLVLLTMSVVVFGQTAADRELLAKIRTEGMEHSQAVSVFDTLTTVICPRLTASPAQKRASEYVRDRLASYGPPNFHLGPWQFGRGWALEGLT